MQGMEPTQGNTGNIGGGDPCREYREYRYMVVGTVSLVQKWSPCRVWSPHRETQGILVISTNAENWTHGENTGNLGI